MMTKHERWGVVAMIVSIFIASFILVQIARAQTSTVTAVVNWSASTQFTDGTAIPAGQVSYNLYKHPPGGAYALVKNTNALTASAPGVTSDTCFAVTAVVANIESDKTIDVCLRKPKVPGTITVTVEVTPSP